MGRAEVARRGVKRGRFVTLEGGEGVGKSTQTAALAGALRARGLDVVQTREPGGTPGAEAIRALLMTGGADRWNAASEALLFAAARADHVARVIAPVLERGAWVVCDRYIDSTRAYQGGSDGLDDADIMTLHRIGSGWLMPDRTLLLDLGAAAGEARVAARDGADADRFAAKGSEHGAAVMESFRTLAAHEPDRIRRIDADGTPADVTARLLHALDDLL